MVFFLLNKNCGKMVLFSPGWFWKLAQYSFSSLEREKNFGKTFHLMDRLPPLGQVLIFWAVLKKMVGRDWWKIFLEGVWPSCGKKKLSNDYFSPFFRRFWRHWKQPLSPKIYFCLPKVTVLLFPASIVLK